jgi:hypothetical protein
MYSIIYYVIIIIIILIIFTFVNTFLPKNHTKNVYENYQNDNKICCLYAYYEKDDLYKSNLEYFINNGILDNIDYYIIINGECSVNIPDKENIKVLKRENKGWDFGAYSYCIKTLNKEYDYYFFLNTSVSGPYLDNKENKDWSIYFIELFKNNVKLVGTSINILEIEKMHSNDLSELYNHNKPYPHVQSMFFCIDNELFNYLKSINFFNEDEINNMPDIHQVIIKKEIGLSQIAMSQGWNINCILSKYKDIDYINIKNDINETSRNGDPYFNNAYFGGSIDKNEVIFYKNNRL